MITGRWGRPSEVLLDLVIEEDGSVRGIGNPGRQNLPIHHGRFDATSGAVTLSGEQVKPDGTSMSFQISGRLDGSPRDPGQPAPPMRARSPNEASRSTRSSSATPSPPTFRPWPSCTSRPGMRRTTPAADRRSRRARSSGRAYSRTNAGATSCSCCRTGTDDSWGSPGASRMRASTRAS